MTAPATIDRVMIDIDRVAYVTIDHLLAMIELEPTDARTVRTALRAFWRHERRAHVARLRKRQHRLQPVT